MEKIFIWIFISYRYSSEYGRHVRVEKIGMIPDFWLCCVSQRSRNQQETFQIVKKNYEANRMEVYEHANGTE